MITYKFISRVPKSCTHGDKMYRSAFRMKNPNVMPDFEKDFLYTHDRKWIKIMRTQGTEQDVTLDTNARPSFYIVTRCDKCDSERLKNWTEQHWPYSPWERRYRFVHALAMLEVHPQLHDTEKQMVLDMVLAYHLTRADFKALDEKPGIFGYRPEDAEQREWHYKLRQVRNTWITQLFRQLEYNEVEGYTDEEAIPPLPLIQFNNMD